MAGETIKTMRVPRDRSQTRGRGTGPLHQRLSAERDHERRTAMIHLLRLSLLRPMGNTAGAFQLARRHGDWLKKWFMEKPGWHLRIDSRCARLRKTPASGALSDSTRGGSDPHTRQPLTPRRYGLLCLALAELGRLGSQATLGDLAKRIVLQMNHMNTKPQEVGANDGDRHNFTLQSRGEREDLVHAVRLLVGLGVLTRIDGDEQGYIANRKRDVLYNIDRESVSAMLNVRRGPSTIQASTLDNRIDGITEEPRAEGDHARREHCRQNLYRQLLEQPVVYFDELSAAERDYLTSQRATLCRTIEQATGLIREVRREGIAMVDEDGKLTDSQVLDPGTDGHAALLVAGYCAQALRADETVVNRAALERYMAQQIKAHRTYWRKDATLPGGEVALVDHALLRLESLRLVRIHDGTIEPRPAVARYAVANDDRDTPTYQTQLQDNWEEVDA